MIEPQCSKCGGSGEIMIHVLTWNERRDGDTVHCSARVDSAEEGRQMIAELGPNAFHANVYSAPLRCECRAERAIEEKPVESVRDWKMAQAGDRS
jgi:hypothetical protein